MQKIDNNEIWKPIPGFEGLYEASDLGNVRSLNYRHTGKTRTLKPLWNGSGYMQVGLWKNGKMKHFLIQRLVFSAFNGEIPDGFVVDHVNNIKTDNRPQNLQLLTPTENTRKAHLGKPSAMKGKKHSADTRAKMAAAAKARHQREKNAGKVR